MKIIFKGFTSVMRKIDLGSTNVLLLILIFILGAGVWNNFNKYTDLNDYLRGYPIYTTDVAFYECVKYNQHLVDFHGGEETYNCKDILFAKGVERDEQIKEINLYWESIESFIQGDTRG